MILRYINFRYLSIYLFIYLFTLHIYTCCVFVSDVDHESRRMYPSHFDCGANSAVNPWLSTAADCKPPAIFDDRSTPWMTPLSRRSLSPHFHAAVHPSAEAGHVTRCDVTESRLTSYGGGVTSSLRNPPHSATRSSSPSSVSAALLQSAASAEVNMMNNSPEQVTNTGMMSDSATTAAAVLRLRTKSHSSSGNRSPLALAFCIAVEKNPFQLKYYCILFVRQQLKSVSGFFITITVRTQ